MAQKHETTYKIVFEWNSEDFHQEGIEKISRVPTIELKEERSEVALRAVMKTIQDVGERVATTMYDMTHAPRSGSVEFGIRLGADVGYITKGHEDAHFVVKLVWDSKS
jgi:hypothetical protein